MKLSVTDTLCDGPTLRQNAVGMPRGSTPTYSTCRFGRPLNQIDRGLSGVGIETILEPGRRPSSRDRGTCEAVVPRDWHSLRVETGGKPVKLIRPIHVVLDVFLARPDDF